MNTLFWKHCFWHRPSILIMSGTCASAACKERVIYEDWPILSHIMCCCVRANTGVTGGALSHVIKWPSLITGSSACKIKQSPVSLTHTQKKTPQIPRSTSSLINHTWLHFLTRHRTWQMDITSLSIFVRHAKKHIKTATHRDSSCICDNNHAHRGREQRTSQRTEAAQCGPFRKALSLVLAKQSRYELELSYWFTNWYGEPIKIYTHLDHMYIF